VPLRLHALGVVTLSFEGRITLQVVDSLDTGRGVQLRLIELDVAAAHGELGKVVLREAEFDTTPYSRLELVGSGAPRLRETLFLDFTLIISEPPDGGPPLVLANKQTATLVDDQLAMFPPRGSVHYLQQPIDLAPVGEPERIIAQLIELPIAVLDEL
jgi:hypothetical protein